MISMLLVTLVLGLVLSAVACVVALIFFSWFRSGERKPGDFRPDQSSGGAHAIPAGRFGRRVRPRSSELPLVGGAAMVLAIVLASVVAGIVLNFGPDQWTLLAIILGGTVAFGLVGFVDDAMKVYRGQGISELAKFAGVLVVSLGASIALNRLVSSARFAYPPYADIPGLGRVLQHTPYAWVIFFILLTVTVSTTTSLAVDFTDGFDGLAGGVLVSAALAFAVIIVSQTQTLSPHAALTSLSWPSVLIMLAMVGALLGYLPFNLPSSFRPGGQGRGRRRARLIMGDTGSLALGGALALVAIITRLELLLIYIGGVLVLEGVSALISARILVKFFRRFLTLPRFNGKRDYAHTEFPLPFLATPLHHHFDLINWNRQRLVYGAWTLGAILAVLGIASANAPYTWERYLARLAALGVIIFVWQVGTATRGFFIGLVRDNPKDTESPARLGLFYGLPYRLFGFALYGRVDTVGVTDQALRDMDERMSLWQRISVFDARTVLGYYCFRAGFYRDAVRIWSRIPDINVKFRPKLAEMILEARRKAALEGDDETAPRSGYYDPRSATPSQPWSAFIQPAGSVASATPAAPASPFGPTSLPLPAAAPDDQFTNPTLQAPRLEPAQLDWNVAPDNAMISRPLWNPTGWNAANGDASDGNGTGQPSYDVERSDHR
ncbi:MAG TPA: hypothetical protein VIG30_00780 [Ktedonobacterales bacterium]